MEYLDCNTLVNHLTMNTEAIDKSPVVKLAFEFSLDIISFCELLESKKKYVGA